MRALACLVLFATAATAGETADRAAIADTLRALNDLPPKNGIFIADATVSPEFDSLWKGRPIAFRWRPRAGPAVHISHEPWGEATIDFSPLRAEMINPRVVTGDIRFVTDDVAVADGASVYDNERRPLFFVLKRSGAGWKIAALLVVR
jgi:hypothetical protein